MATSASDSTASKTDLSSAFTAAMHFVHAENTVRGSAYAQDYVKVLIDHLRDGVVFVDINRSITVWNRTAELMTDISADRILGNQLTPQLLSMRDPHGAEVPITDCPLEECFRSATLIQGDYRILGRSGREVKVEAAFAPVLSQEQTMIGAVVILHDASIQTNLTRQIKDLFESSIIDPLTQVYNRAEFERVLRQFIDARNSSDFQCSLIVCDIDFFKSINDNYNHYVGDQCLIKFADILKRFVRSNDLVARYGGEEFVILCGNSDLGFAAQRAEEIRQMLTQTAISMLDGKCITASFGVAELYPGESGTDFFVRADSALLKAKEMGRNRVVQSGQRDVLAQPKTPERRSLSAAGLTWHNPAPEMSLLVEEFVTATPITMLVEKLRGYILETNAKIISVSANFAKFQLDVSDSRTNKQRGTFVVEIEFQEGKPESYPANDRRRRTTPLRNFIRIAIGQTKKKWFSRPCEELATVAMRDLRRYFMINEEHAKLGIERAATKSTRDQ
jgi:diguanylate cyclase (GGDEF)-like protein